MEYTGDCLSDTEALEGACVWLIKNTATTKAPPQDEVEKTNDDWTTPPSPPPEDRLPKRSKLDDLVESSSTPISISIPTRTMAPSNNNTQQQYRSPSLNNITPFLDSSAAIVAQMEQQAHLARLERKKTEMAAIIAAAAAAQQAEEQRALLEAAAAAEARCKEEEKLAERERRKKERKEREEGNNGGGGGGGRKDNREKRLVKLVGAVVVKTMSKYRARMDVDTFKKHAKEVRTVPPPHLHSAKTSATTAHAHYRGERKEIVKFQRKQTGRVVRREKSQDQKIRKRIRPEDLTPSRA